jgi:NADH:ubiquinone oxidoreductase subunit 3 (subunit A)
MLNILSNILLTPPMAFILLLLFSGLFSLFSNVFAAKGIASDGKTKAYACGEDNKMNQAQPDFSQFFHIAFFFTIMHVVVLIIASVPKGINLMACFYLIIAILSLGILFRR